jgi:hypothetical protein
VDLENTVCALDSTTIDLCLAPCPWRLAMENDVLSKVLGRGR